MKSAGCFLILVFISFSVPAEDRADGERPYLEAMADEHAGDNPVATGLGAAAAVPARDIQVTVSEPIYGDIDGAEIRGFMAAPMGTGPTGVGVILIHEWWGLNDNIKSVAKKLAALGYTALAVDLYGGRIGSDADGARSLASEAAANPERALDNLTSAHRFLKSATGDGRIATLGWCFGGGWSLRSAIHLGERLDAAIIYYGRLITDKRELSNVAAPVLGIFGGQDRGIPVSSVAEFEASMATLGRRAEIHVFPDAGHAFANPSGTRYREQDARQAWDITLRFLDEQLRADPTKVAPKDRNKDGKKILLERGLGDH